MLISTRQVRDDLTTTVMDLVRHKPGLETSVNPLVYEPRLNQDVWNNVWDQTQDMVWVQIGILNYNSLMIIRDEGYIC